jgi:hypothetical protein
MTKQEEAEQLRLRAWSLRAQAEQTTTGGLNASFRIAPGILRRKLIAGGP